VRGPKPATYPDIHMYPGDVGPHLASAVVLGDISDPTPNDPKTGLDVPTTATVAAGRLWVVDARFEIMPPTPDTKYWITQLPLRPENA
jgi:hypothetical protein